MLGYPVFHGSLIFGCFPIRFHSELRLLEQESRVSINHSYFGLFSIWPVLWRRMEEVLIISFGVTGWISEEDLARTD